MRRGLRSHLTYANTSKQAAFALAVAGALAVGLIAFPGSAGAAVPNCTPPTTSGNDSCVKLQVAPNNPNGTNTNSRLFFRFRTEFVNLGDCNAGGCWHNVTLDFDDDFRLNLGSFPTCSVTKAYGGNQNIAAVWAACGPGAGSANNAYLSTQVAPTGFGCAADPCVSGEAQGVAGFPFNACVLIFNGPLVNNQRTITLYARAPVTSSQCASSPATNTSGSVTRVAKGTLTTSPLTGYGRRLTIANIETQLSGIFMFDFNAYIKRGIAFQARCPSGTSPWKLRGLFVFSGTGQANDTFTSMQTCS